MESVAIPVGAKNPSRYARKGVTVGAERGRAVPLPGVPAQSGNDSNGCIKDIRELAKPSISIRAERPSIRIRILLI
jgi:hypothetical protein